MPRAAWPVPVREFLRRRRDVCARGRAPAHLRDQGRPRGTRLHGSDDGAAGLERMEGRGAEGELDRARGRGRLADGAEMIAEATWIDRQLPQRDEVFIDHVGYFVADLDAAGAQLERFGFRVSLSNVQTNADARGALKPSGTSNRLPRRQRGILPVPPAAPDTPPA